jgi:predicted HTH domain antitoxin
MQVSIAVPDDIAQQLEAEWQDVPRRTLEILAVEAYRSGTITAAEVQRMLGLSSRWEVDQFLKNTQADIDYTDVDLQQDIEAIRRLTTP